MPSQVISIAFRIWLIRNVDLVKATFECKFRVFLETRQHRASLDVASLVGHSLRWELQSAQEWLDESAVGLEKGKKAQQTGLFFFTVVKRVVGESFVSLFLSKCLAFECRPSARLKS